MGDFSSSNNHSFYQIIPTTLKKNNFRFVFLLNVFIRFVSGDKQLLLFLFKRLDF